MNKVLCVSENVSCQSYEKLSQMGYFLVKVPQCNFLERPVSAHPDMFMAKIGDKFFYDSNIAHLFVFLGESADFRKKLVECERKAHLFDFLEYPYNVEFNCVAVGNKLICNERYTNEKILQYAKESSMQIINVKQGYAKCSTCVVSDNAIITEDESIAKGAMKAGIDVLLIDKGFVKLKGYEYGFIGGCSGLLEKNLLAFDGNISFHPECEEIIKFCQQNSVEIVSLCDSELCDNGSILRIF